MAQAGGGAERELARDPEALGERVGRDEDA